MSYVEKFMQRYCVECGWSRNFPANCVFTSVSPCEKCASYNQRTAYLTDRYFRSHVELGPLTGPGLDGAVVKPSPVPVVVEPAPVRYGYTGGNLA